MNATGFFQRLITTVLLSCAAALTQAQVRLTIQADQPGARINPAMWGIFFEDINLGADGGLYAELVKNRSFEFPDAMMGWKPILGFSSGPAQGSLAIRSDAPFNPANPHYLRIESAGAAAYGVANEGFRGIGVREGQNYDFSAQIRAAEGSPALRIELVNGTGQVLASAKLSAVTPEWKKHSATLRVMGTEPKARLKILLQGKGKVDFDMVSLFPQKTWMNRPGGLRTDMVQLLADLKPGFLRFPGGCIVEGNVLTNRYQWKTTIRPIEERKLIVNRWNFEFKHRPTPDYYQSFGLGFFEYFQLCEDIGAEPLPILNCGMACQFNSGQLVPLDQLDPYIQDALDLIEFANGPVTSPWGAKRAALGHPQPFKLKLLGVGNEQWGPQYLERYALFQKALKGKHPEVQLVSAAGPSPADDRFDFLWPKMRELKADIVDEHCYANPTWFFTSVNRFDGYDRNGPKVFFGEYAAQSDKIVSVDNKNNWECALSEAAFMTGLERNADVVRMASYAPLFGHVDGWQWTPNLIWADNLRSYGTPNYHVQALFAQNRGDVVLPVKLEGNDRPVAVATGGIGLGTFQTSAEFKDVQVTRGSETLFSGNFTKAGPLPRDGSWSMKDGVLAQSDTRATSTVWAGDGQWSDYALTLKARKLSGSEGFIIVVRNDPPNTRVQWNVGGWGNTKHGIQSWLGVQEQLVAQTPGQIEVGRWYDVKIELKGAQMNCYLDGKLVQSAKIPVPQRGGFFASAVRDDKAGEVVVKLVNASAQSRDVALELAGVRTVKPGAKGILLAGEKLSDLNDFAAPNRVAPRSIPVPATAPKFTQNVPANSFLVLRVPVD
jgi:alpha-L-arabinofuranosidase